MKVVLLIWYLNKNFCFRKIRSHLAPKIDFEIWKCPIFDGSSSNSLTRCKQILSDCSFVTKKLLNFAWLPMKFHNCGHISVYRYSSKVHARHHLLRQIMIMGTETTISLSLKPKSPLLSFCRIDTAHLSHKSKIYQMMHFECLMGDI